MMIKYRDYWVALFISSAIGAIVPNLDKHGDSLPFLASVLLGIFFLIILALVAGLVILAVSWIFTKDFSLLRFMRITATVSIVMTLIFIISLFLELSQK